MDVDALRAAAGLNPLPIIRDKDAEHPQPERGHGRGKDTTHQLPGQHPELRGIPLVGSGPGVIAGTRPGDPSCKLEQSERDLAASRALHAAMMRRARQNLKGKP